MEEKKLFVGNIPYQTTDQELNQLFSQFGTVEQVDIIQDRETGRSRGFAFVLMSTAEEARAAVQQLEGSDFNGREMKVNIARPKNPR